MIRRFSIDRHDEYGYLGLSPLWMPDHQSDPLNGMGVAHDVLEHGPNDPIEFCGLGGALWVRRDWFSSRPYGNRDIVANVASDFVNLYHLWQGEPIPQPGRTRALDSAEAEARIQAIVNRAALMVREEHDEDERAAIDAWFSVEQRAAMCGWFRKGYRAAERRHRAHPQWRVAHVFGLMEKAVDHFLATEGGDYEGGSAVMYFDIGREFVRLAATTEDGEEY